MVKEYSLQVIIMQYVGSKNRISKYIAPIIQKAIDDNNITTYYEPFVGGANMIDKIKCKTKIGNDNHKELMAMWNELQNGWNPPPFISEEEYQLVKNNKENYPDYYVGYVGFHCTFGAKYFGGYARNGDLERYKKRIPKSTEMYNNTIKQLPNIKGIDFICGDYKDLDIHNSVIYCDPPYENTTKYSTGSFNYEEFWQWCRDMSKDNIVFVSEYNAPDDFECVWHKESLANFDSKRGNDTDKKSRVEKLFAYNI